MDTLKRGISSKKVIKLYPDDDQVYALLIRLPVKLDHYLGGDDTVEAIEIIFDGLSTTFPVAFLKAVRAAQDQSLPAGYPPA